MKPISLHVDEASYRELKSLAERTGRPVAELIREAMAEYAAHRKGAGGSLFDLVPHPSGALLAPWTRAHLLDERLDRCSLP
jgi:16S rRNA U516 pseudouridylate synthase RsuA-like enzyme